MNRKSLGFTIVELLIVIVVIGVLAAISIVAYNGISNKANDAAVQSDLSNLAKQISMFKAENGVLPTGIGTPPKGIDNFRLTRSAYRTTGFNFYYCRGVVGGEERFGIGAISLSGKKWYIEDSGGVKEYIGSYGFAGSFSTCPAVIPGVEPGYNYAPAGYNPTQGWASWTE